ncbi:MAG: Rpn family recombination-promoting nuclease/putative transposase [Magnetococcales bacterium]|nr:Rpn family recombination-promoting nuclease/putative transposase [Magnetococcales bacterium]MBF0116394.1 Rpn family recombination-promoting nuclease/putative transposase [Magnetococcales bacterium]
MADSTHTSDSIYHRLFAYPEMVADLLRNFLDADLLAELDLSQMRRLNTKFTAKMGQRRRGDIVWEIPIRAGGSLFLLLLLEFRSEVDEWMVLRLGVYTGLLYQQLVDERKLKPADGLPPVLPVVIFNGETRWDAATSLRELICLPAGSPLWKYQPEMRYHVIDEGRFPEEDLKGLQSLTAIFFRIGHPGSPASILEASRDLVEWFAKHPEGPPVKRLFRELLAVGLERFKVPHSVPSIPEELEEVVNMLATHVEKWSRDIEQKGWQAGIQAGEQAGEKKGKVEMLTRQLQRLFGDLPTWASDKIAKADLSTLEEWSLRILDAPTLESILADPS